MMHDAIVSKMAALIAAAHSPQAAERYIAYTPTMGDLSKTWQIARQVISTVPEQPSACVPMTADLAKRLRLTIKDPLFIVAGSLQMKDKDGTFIFGGPEPMDCENIFEESDANWDGHLWLMLGPYVVDISFMRSVRLDRKRKNLKARLRQLFGKVDDAVIDRQDKLSAKGLLYLPQCVLSEPQVVRLLESADFA